MTYPPTDHGPADVIDDYVGAGDDHGLRDTLADLEAWMRSERGDPAEALMLVYEAVLALEAETGGELGDDAPLGIVYQHVGDEDPGWLRGLLGLGEKADWSREEGPNGGTRWVNADGDVRYREPADVDKVPESETGALAKDLEEGDRIVLDGEEGVVGEVENLKGMGGGMFVAMRDDQDEVHTERVGPNHEFELEGEDPGDGTDDAVLPDGVEADGVPAEALGPLATAFDDLGGTDTGIERVATTSELGDAYDGAFAAYTADRDMLAVDPDMVQSGAAEEWSEDGVIAGDDAEHVMRHELTHAVVEQSGDGPPMWYDEDGEREAAKGLSVLAGQNPNELVAEVGALIMAGEEVDDEIMTIYEKYGGPEL